MNQKCSIQGSNPIAGSVYIRQIKCIRKAISSVTLILKLVCSEPITKLLVCGKILLQDKTNLPSVTFNGPQ